MKDVAEAHINAYEIASANGRYLLAERVTHYSQLASILRDMYPTLLYLHECNLTQLSKPLKQTR